MKPIKADRIHKILRYICISCVIVFGFISIIGTGGGGFGSWLYPLWIETDIVVSDIDVDGRNDVLTLARLSTSESNKEGHLRVYRQIDQGGFSAPSTYIIGEYPWQLVVSDIDGDTLPDLLVTDPDLEDVRLLLQDPNSIGQFISPRQIASGMRTYETAVADFNNDSTFDIAIVDSYIGSNRIVMLYQDPVNQGMFLPAVDLMLPGSSSNIAAGDLDGDGLADLLTWIYLERSGWTPNGVLAISLQQPNVDYKAKLTVVLQESVPGTFAVPVDTSLAGIKGIDDAVVADLNGDGRPDFAVVGFFPEGSPSTVKSRLNLFMQSGGGAFSLAGVYNMPISVSRVAAGDIDDDGLNDLVVLGSENQSMVLIQSHNMMGTFNPPNPL